MNKLQKFLPLPFCSKLKSYVSVMKAGVPQTEQALKEAPLSRQTEALGPRPRLGGSRSLTDLSLIGG